MLDIKDVKITVLKNPQSRLVAYAECVIFNLFKICDMRIISGQNKLFVQMPNRKLKQPINGVEYKDICHPINAGARNELNAVILEEYEKEIVPKY